MEAMSISPGILSQLPEGFADLPVEDAVRLLLQNVISDHDTYFDLRRRHLELVNWIEQE